LRAKVSVLVAVVCIAVLMLTLGVPTAAARGTTGPSTAGMGAHTIVVRPNGQDDTAHLQAAFDTCTSHGWTCTIQLVKGTYYTDQITVYGFQGSFVGAGQGATIVQGLPNLASPTADPFWAAAPGPANPWPDLFTFVNGTFRVSHMTVADTYYNPVPNGWDNFGTPVTYLWADIMVTGERANAAFDRFALLTGPGTFSIPVGNPSSFDSSGGLVYEGMLLPTGWENEFGDQIPVSGTFSVTNCYLNGTDSAVWVENTLDASVTISSNSITSSPTTIALDDLASSLVWVNSNQITNVMYAGAVFAYQSLFKSDLTPSTIYVTGNYIESNWFGSGVWVQDFGPQEGLASTLSVVATGNDFVFDNGCGCAYLEYSGALGAVDTVSAILSWNTVGQGGWGVLVSGGTATVSGNLILGTYVGVYLGSAFGATYTAYSHVAWNVIKNSVDYGIAVVGGSSNNTVSHNLVKGSGLDDLYWDGTGTGNVWFGNVFGTSSPPGL
jgi:hypothetical protein